MASGITCPSGHASQSTDYCDTCGSPIPPDRASTPSAVSVAEGQAPARPPGVVCPNCGISNAPGALFCEACGYDYTTGTMPRPVETSVLDLDTPVPLSIPADLPAAAVPAADLPVAAVPAAEPRPPDAVDAASSAPETESDTFDWVLEIWVDPEWYALQDSPDPVPSPGLPDIVPLRKRSLLIGRPSRSRNIDPDIDCEPDTGISRRQAELSTDGARWFIEDLGSANGTFVADAAGGLPSQPLPSGRRHELSADVRLYLGAWTRLVLRRATSEEQEAYAAV